MLKKNLKINYINNIDYEIVDNGCILINKIIENNKYDIIFMDNNMPNLKGYVVIKILRSIGIKSLIIGVTGDNLDKNNNEMLDNGANIVFTKPIRVNDITTISNLYMHFFN
jgi:CheY-like chemotaxis protein